MALPENAAPILAQALGDLLGKPTPGSMAFIRCLPPDAARDLANDARFAVLHWQIAVVADQIDSASRAITADVAVGWRNDKSEAVLLLVDTESAGAGMDGIYNAAREIGQAELFAAALDKAHGKLHHGGKGFAQKALSRARRLARNQSLSPWREFTYLCQASYSMAAVGGALTEIGLWPVAVDNKPDDEDLDKAARLVERLLPRQGPHQSAEARVVALKLSTADEALGRELSAYLRGAESLPRLEALRLLNAREGLWLNRLRPGLFDAQTLQRISWVDWRGATRRRLAWSGLTANDDDRLELRLSLDDKPQNRVRLEVRWTTEPANLANGAVDYAVEVRAGADVLAEKTIAHAAKGPQKCVFTQDDFGELEESARFEAEVVIRALVAENNPVDNTEESPFRAVSEDFILCFGETTQPTKSSAGNVFPTLALAAIQVAPDIEAFDRLAETPGNKHAFSPPDAKGYITCRAEGKAARVFCPNLLLDLVIDWVAKSGTPGRWRLKVRADGTRAGSAEFVPVPPTGEVTAERFAQASRAFATWLSPGQGPLAVLYSDRKQITDYVNAATAWWEGASADAMLIHTLEVLSVSGQRIGLIVLPTHPVRVAWQQAFDMLARCHRYEEQTAPAKAARLLGALTGAHYPAMLPGFEKGESFIFADSLGFHAVAMTATDDEEPRATVALLSRLLTDGDAANEELMAPSVGKSASELLGEEVARYLVLHPETRRVRVHALRPGDAMPAARALGVAVRAVEGGEDVVDGDGNGEGTSRDERQKRAFHLDLFPATGRRALAGRFLSATAERRRSGAGVVPEEDRWLLDSVTRPGGVTLPRLAWARRDVQVPETPAHLALAFDIFTTRIECLPVANLPAGALEAHGMALTPERSFIATPLPRWESVVPPNPEGEKHPSGRVFSDRLVKAHSALLRGVANRLGGRVDEWPVLVTEVSPEGADMLTSLHRLCDWVVTVDRHAGVEYFDSPRDLPKLYDAYLIDCVPERDDLGFLQLITSTSSLDEIVRLLDSALGEMGLSVSPRNCAFLLGALKAVSGRLAMRLAKSGTVAQELVALALTHSYCAVAGENAGPWLSLKEGFFVPMDDVPELFRAVGEKKRVDESGQQADLLYVTVGRRGGLRIGFVEVKFRRYLKTARTTELIETITGQLDASRARWEKLFGQATTPLEKTVQRARLARVLRFYARKGRRHTLSEDAFERIERELLKICREGTEYALPALDEQERPGVGFVFCPEYGAALPAPIGNDIWLFGPALLPESQRGEVPSTPTRLDPSPREPAVAPNSTLMETQSVVPLDTTHPPAVELLLGHREGSGESVNWKVSIQGNPHLLIVGLPGMGKTTCLINLCRQLAAASVAPIVFSYHQDIDEKLGSLFGDRLQTVRYAGLGFNPLQVVGDAPLGYMDNVAMLRDIFAAIFPDLGDVQLGRLREALKQSYVDQGWAPGKQGALPAFSAFYDNLKADPKPDKGLLTRLAELSDYGLFDATSGAPSLLDSAVPALVQIHSSQNEVLQRAFSTFVLHNLYQTMFRRGTQNRITHAVIFDEAHRAAKLKLIPTMAKECRKFGLAFVVASQEAKDFDQSLFTSVANYLALRVNEADAKLMAKILAPSDKVTLYADRIKLTGKFKAWFYTEGMRTPVHVVLSSGAN